MHSLGTNAYIFTTVSRCECCVKNLNMNKMFPFADKRGRFGKMNQVDIAFYNELFDSLLHKGMLPSLP
jgi:beta-glucosidase/6-phospho-beta-glucosidase/beta-galactosidase